MERFLLLVLVWLLPAAAYGILLLFLSRLFPLRCRPWLVAVAALLFPLGNLPKLVWGMFSPASDLVRLAFLPVGLVLIPLLLFRGSVWKRLAVNLSLFACQMLGEMTVSATLLPLEEIPAVDIARSILPILLPYSLVTLAVQAVGSCAVLFFAKALGARRFSRLYIPAFLFPVSLLGTAYSRIIPVGPWLFVLSLLLGCGALAALMYLLGSLEEKEALERRLQETRHAMELEQAHYRSVEEQREKLSRLRHDFKNHLASIAALLQSGEEGAARQLIGAVSRAIDETRESTYCPIPVVNAVLSGKERLCREKGITLAVDLSLPGELTVEPIHLCSIFANLLDNAIRAAEQSGVPQPTITLRSLQEGDYLFLKVTNPSPPPSPPPEGRGMGQRILQDLGRQYGGGYQWEYADGTFTALVCLLA